MCVCLGGGVYVLFFRLFVLFLLLLNDHFMCFDLVSKRSHLN